MTAARLFILYVADPIASAAFYAKLIGHEPSHAFPSYASFDLGSGFSLGLLSTASDNLASTGTGNRSELAFIARDAAGVDAVHETWKAQGVVIEQPPVTASFGRTFVALDPDGHRVRVCLADD